MSKLVIPDPTQPAPLAGYWSTDNADKLLAWDYVSQRMQAAKNYWLATVNPDGQPHAVPVWGVWIDDTLYFGGGPQTRWSRNLAVDPRVSIHLDDSDQAVMLEGRVTRLGNAASAQMTRIDDVYEVKYNMRHGPPIWQLHPRKVIAWTAMETATRWCFD